MTDAFAAPRSRDGGVILGRLLAVFGGGAAIGAIVALLLYGSDKVSHVLLVPAAILALLPTLVLRNVRLYWLAVFFLSLQFQFSKNLNDGLAIMRWLDIDYTIWSFTFEVMATDLVLIVLGLLLVNDCLFRGKKFRLPPVAWLAVGYLGICLLSILRARWPFLGFVELSRQVKFFLAFVIALNCIDTRRALKVVGGVSVAIVAIQGGVTIARFLTGYMVPFVLGDTHQDMDQIREYLTVDRSDDLSWVRAFGTLGSPGSTTRLCNVVTPLALFLSVRNPFFRLDRLFLLLTVFGLGGLVLTVVRVHFIVLAVQLALVFWFLVRFRVIRRSQVVIVLLLALIGIGAAIPKLDEQFSVRTDSISVRLRQYEATLDMIADNPLLGVGLNNGTGEKQRYAKVTYVPYDADTQFYKEPTHNFYLSLASEIGIPGTLLFFVFFGRAFLEAWRHARGSPSPEARLLGASLVVMFLSMATGMMMDPVGEYPVQIMLWVWAAICFNLPRIAAETAPADQAPAATRSQAAMVASAAARQE